MYSEESGVPSNSYGWYRKSAQCSGTVSIGDMKIPVYKEGGVWYLDETRLIKAIKYHRKKMKDIEQITADYEKGIIHGNNGDKFRMAWGGYEMHDSFRFVWSDMARTRKMSCGTWYCNSCNTVAGTRHDNPECHLCLDWNGCNRDCTLSEVYCEKCGYRLRIQDAKNKTPTKLIR